MTLLVGSIFVERLADVERQSTQAWAQGAEAVELRIDEWEDDPASLRAFLASKRDRRWIVTCRSREEGGRFRGDTSDRVSLLLATARQTGAYVDFEFGEFTRSENIRQKILLAAKDGPDAAPRLILSWHDFGGAPSDLAKRGDEMVDAARKLGHPQSVACKIAYRAGSACESFAALDLMHRHGSAICAIAMDECGAWTRVLAKKLGAFATYAALCADDATAPGQLSLVEMTRRFRWGLLNKATLVFGVVGNPVAHSRSPFVFNRWFVDHDIDGVYLPLRVSDGTSDLNGFLDGCVKRPWLDVSGLSVTVPHKSAARAWAGPGADSLSGWLGAVNTLAILDERVKAYNTDCHAAIDSLAAALGVSRVGLAGKKIDVLGTGGAARAVIYGLYELGSELTVLGRNPSAAAALAEEFRCTARPWEERTSGQGEVLVNATSVGMWPRSEDSPMPAGALARYRMVYDLIYNPLETRLLREARESGVAALNGLDMFVRQAAVQMELWTGVVPDAAAMKAELQDVLSAEAGGR